MNNQIDFVLPALYDKFLSEMGEDGEFNLEDSGIILYSKADLVERNTTYQIEEWEPDYFMIGQDFSKHLPYHLFLYQSFR